MPAALLLVTLLTLAVAGCGGKRGTPLVDGGSGAVDAYATDTFGCVPEPVIAAKPIVHFGPDVSLELPCAGQLSVPIASLSNQGDLAYRWTVSVKAATSGIFEASVPGGFSCPSRGVDVVNAIVRLSSGAEPGQTFDATYTFTATAREFPTATVAVHVRAVAPAIALEPVLDFGDVFAGQDVSSFVTFRNLTRTMLAAWTTEATPAPFSLVSPLVLLPPQAASTLKVTVQTNVLGANVLGEHAARLTWHASPIVGGEGGPCSTTKTLELRAHVVPPPDGGAPDGPAPPGDASTGSVTIP